MNNRYFIAKGKHLVVPVTKQEYEEHWNKKRKEPITNDQWRKTCPAKEFAEFISSILDYGFGIDYAPVNPMGENVNTTGDIEKWLKQLHISKDV